MWMTMTFYLLSIRVVFFIADAAQAPSVPAQTAAAPSAPAKRLDNLFFIEEPKTAHVCESKCVRFIMLNRDNCTHKCLMFQCHKCIIFNPFSRGHCNIYCQSRRWSHSECEMDEGQVEADHTWRSHHYWAEGPGGQAGDQRSDQIWFWTVQMCCI